VETNSNGINVGAWCVMIVLRDLHLDHRQDVFDFCEQIKNTTDRGALIQEFLSKSLPVAVQRMVKLMQVLILVHFILI
jgi:hypothetical protein